MSQLGYRNKEILFRHTFVEGRTQVEIANLYKVSTGTIEKWCSRLGVRPGKFKNKIPDPLIDLGDPYFAYWLGLYSTDGWYSSSKENYSIMLKDHQPLKEMSKYYGREFNSRAKKPYFYFSKSYKLFELLWSYDLLVNKTYRGRFISEFPTSLSQDLYIRGLLDGDGSFRKKTFRFGNCSPYLIMGMQKYFLSKGVELHFNKKVTKKGIPFFTVTSRIDAFDTIKEIYSHEPLDLCIPRKCDMLVI